MKAQIIEKNVKPEYAVIPYADYLRLPSGRRTRGSSDLHNPPVVWEIAERVKSLQEEREKCTRDFVEETFRSPQSEAYLEKITQAALSTPTNAAAIMMANLHLVGPTDLRPALDSLDRPAFFVYSSVDWAVEQAELVRECWPDMPVEIIDETAHALFVNKPEQFNRVLERFLASLAD